MELIHSYMLSEQGRMKKALGQVKSEILRSIHCFYYRIYNIYVVSNNYFDIFIQKCVGVRDKTYRKYD